MRSLRQSRRRKTTDIFLCLWGGTVRGTNTTVQGGDSAPVRGRSRRAAVQPPPALQQEVAEEIFLISFEGPVFITRKPLKEKPGKSPTSSASLISHYTFLFFPSPVIKHNVKTRWIVAKHDPGIQLTP